VRQSNPNISVATIYNTLEHFKTKNLLCKLETSQDKMRYDAAIKKHYHICNPENDMMIDYSDPELDSLLKTHFEKKDNINITDIKLLIIGNIE
jgi:Fe2+ or Zn2+ uptake regulation protein